MKTDIVKANFCACVVLLAVACSVRAGTVPFSSFRDMEPTNLITSNDFESGESGEQERSVDEMMIDDFAFNPDEIDESLAACAENPQQGSQPVQMRMVRHELPADYDYPQIDAEAIPRPVLYTTTPPPPPRRPPPPPETPPPPPEDPPPPPEIPTTPEPATVVILGLGLAGLLPLAHRSGKKKNGKE